MAFIGKIIFLKNLKKSVDKFLHSIYNSYCQCYAGVAELADAQASGACGSNIVWVQVPSPACEEGAVAISNSSFSV